MSITRRLQTTRNNTKFSLDVILRDEVGDEPVIWDIPESFFLFPVTSRFNINCCEGIDRVFMECRDEMYDLGFDLICHDMADSGRGCSSEFIRKGAFLTIQGQLYGPGDLTVVLEASPVEREICIYFTNSDKELRLAKDIDLSKEDLFNIQLDENPSIQK